MNKRFWSNITFFCVCLCLASIAVSCGSLRKSPISSKNLLSQSVEDPLTPEQRRKFDYYFHEAVRLKQKGDMDAAFEMYNHCLDIHPGSAVTLYELAKFHMYLGQAQKGESYLRQPCRQNRAIIGIRKRLQLIIKEKGSMKRPSVWSKKWLPVSPRDSNL